MSSTVYGRKTRRLDKKETVYTTTAQLWYVSKYRNDFASIFERLEKPGAADATLKIA